MPACPCCILCGAPCESDRFRFTPVQSVQALLRRRCIRTAFHFGAILARPEEDRCAICFHCINWRRRSRRLLLAPRLVYTPLDSILMFALTPGHAEDPDSRCFVRLARTALDPANGFASLVPDPARAVLEAAVGPTHKARAAAALLGWWDANERTPFFRHPGTSRAVRRMLSRVP
jgi:hypothetical protein